MEWQPIETAPRDGAELLLCAADPLVVGRFYRGVGQWADANPAFRSKAGWFWAFGIRPTHWMPLPAPPPKRDWMLLGSFTAGARLADRPDQRASVNTDQGVL
jgi:hypothetical protein